jgi:hypothetical protein
MHQAWAILCVKNGIFDLINWNIVNPNHSRVGIGKPFTPTKTLKFYIGAVLLPVERHTCLLLKLLYNKLIIYNLHIILSFKCYILVGLAVTIYLPIF